MKKPTIAIDTPFQKSDAYGALSMPVYHTLAYEFADADVMSDAFCGRIEEPDYSRVMNPTVNYLELKVKALTQIGYYFSFGSYKVCSVLDTVQFIDGDFIKVHHVSDNMVRTLFLFKKETAAGNSMF
jgi:O-acetylhomoserine (thiol)-lyase